MRIWFGCLLILVIMLATLSVAPSLIEHSLFFHSSTLSSSLPPPKLLTVGLVITLVVIICLLWLVMLAKQSINQAEYPPTNHSYRTLSLSSSSVIGIQITLALLITLALTLHCLQTVANALSNDIRQPIRVLATIKPIGISDSHYDASMNMGYRQLVEVVSAEPLTLSHFQSSQPLSQTSTQSDTSIQSLIGKKILLSARQNSFDKLSKKFTLPAGFSTQFDGLNQLQPRQSAQMMLAIHPLPSIEEGFAHRWLRSRHINAQANILAYNQIFIDMPDSGWQDSLNQWRYDLRRYFLEGLSTNWTALTPQQQQAQAVTLSLLTGDRALINKDTKDLYQLSGISHLLAISGTHVLFLAIILSTLVSNGVNRFYPPLYNHLASHNLRWLVMVFGAMLYALFTGFDVPSARTVYMLIAVGLARLLLLSLSSRQVLLIVAVIMAVYDPYVLWQAGFWLSFVAVMLLISYDISSNRREDFLYIGFDSLEKPTSLISKVVPFITLQLWIFITLLPLSLLLFEKVSLWGVLVNLFAIGFYGWLIVPLNLLAGLFYLIPWLGAGLAGWLWAMVSWLLQIMHHALSWLVNADNPTDNSHWLYTPINAGILLVVGLICLPMLLPRHTFSRIWSIPPMILLSFLLLNQSDSSQLSHSAFARLKHNQPTTQVTLLDSKLTGTNRQVQTLLLSHRPSHKLGHKLGQQHWLIVANHGFYSQKQAKQTAQPSSKDQQQLIAQWQQALSKLGISSLTGIIIQTPSPELLHASQTLKDTLPVGYIWLAGNKHLAPTASHVLGCDTQRTWTSDEGELIIEAITGWQDIEDKGVWSCAIQIRHTDSQSIGLIGLVAPYQVYADSNANTDINTNNTNNNNANNTTASTSQQPTNNGLIKANTPLLTHQLIINAGAKQDRLWQLWSLLCPIDKNKTTTTDSTDSMTNMTNMMSTQPISPQLLMTHSHNGLPTEWLKQHPDTAWLLSDKPTDHNQQKLANVFLEWQSQQD